MTARTGTARGLALLGLTPIDVEIRATIDDGPAGLVIAGMSDPAARESRVRIRSALAAVGHSIPSSARVELTYATLPPSTACLDLPIAAALLRAMGAPLKVASTVPLVGELALSGNVRAVRGIIPRLGRGPIVIPKGNASEAKIARDVGAWTFTIDSLADLGGPSAADLEHVEHVTPSAHVPHGREDLPPSHRELFDACQGKPRVLLIGSPGAGKTMLARRLASMLAPLTEDEFAEVSAIHSAAGLVAGLGTMTYHPPFRAPHHTASEVGMVGGQGRPGEIALAHRGVLFLDEWPEFRAGTRNAILSALRSGYAEHHAGQIVRLPGSPRVVVFTANPCPCGGGQRCTCSPKTAAAYRERLAAITPPGTVVVNLPAIDLAELGR